MRTALVGLAIVGSVIFGLAAGGALAQTPPRSAPTRMVTYPDGKVYPQAPIGHRQPTLNTLPPDLARRERLDEPPLGDGPDTNPREGGIDPQLRICSGC
jgi:hypothetical protein